MSNGKITGKVWFVRGALERFTSYAKNFATRATLQRKLKKLVDTKVLYHSAFFTEALAESNKYSLFTQEKNVNVIKLKSTKSSYERLLKKIQGSNDYILTLPNFKIIIDVVESSEDEDDEPLYQGHKLANYSREKRYLLDHAQYFVKKIID